MQNTTERKDVYSRITAKIVEHLEKGELTSLRKGESVSTSEIAKQLLESSPTDRLEVAELLREPTESLLRIRKKCEAHQSLSRAEWTAFAYFVQQGSEAFDNNPLPRESCIAILEAFRAIHELRKEPNPGKDKYYLGNLPSDFRPADKKQFAPSDTLGQTIAETLRQLADPVTKWRPILAARDLYVFLEDGEVRDANVLNRELHPYWEALWRVAARGHYFLHRRPVRRKPNRHDSVVQPAIPNVTEANYTLSFVRGEGNDLSLLLSFPGPRAPMYPMSSYPLISEFRAMLNGLTAESQSWNGEQFFGYTAVRGRETEFWFRAHANGITFGFSEDEWGAVRKLFGRAWEMPEIQATWAALVMEYGDL